MKRKISKAIYWTPRILSIFFILFLMMFSLDIFDLKLNFWGTMLGLFMHNIPALILLGLLIVSWKHELVGAITFAAAGILYIALLLMKPNFEWYMIMWSLQISGPAFLISYLFFLNWRRKGKPKKVKRHKRRRAG